MPHSTDYRYENTATACTASFSRKYHGGNWNGIVLAAGSLKVEL